MHSMVIIVSNTVLHKALITRKQYVTMYGDDVNETYCSDHVSMHTNTESLCCILGTNIMSYQLCLS